MRVHQYGYFFAFSALVFVSITLKTSVTSEQQFEDVIGSKFLAAQASSNAVYIDRLKSFYQKIADPSTGVKSCADRSMLMPQCLQCIPGTQKSGKSNSCDEYIKGTKDIREEIGTLTKQRFGTDLPSDREFGLYPYLEKPDFLSRQIIFGKLLSSAKGIKHLMDIGAYYNPINLFLSPHMCPESVIVIEPILDPLSVMVPCGTKGNYSSTRSTHVLFLPITFKYYMETLRGSSLIPMPETIVCVGCDSVYGPNKRMLESSFIRPYTLYFEYPSEYVHNAAFKKMGIQIKDPSKEELTFHHKYQAKSNETIYTKRVMKVIEYRE
jgi:hypothetical protein